MSNPNAEQAFTCPRRVEDGRASDNSPFHLDGPMKDVWHQRGGHRACSYCGSMNADEFMARLEAGDVRLTPTDKRYKVYVEGAGLNGAKFYFQHMSREQQDRFIALYNEKRMRLAYPGHFYVLPFFCSSAPAPAEGK